MGLSLFIGDTEQHIVCLVDNVAIFIYSLVLQQKFVLITGGPCWPAICTLILRVFQHDNLHTLIYIFLFLHEAVPMEHLAYY
jgi:hypothetical protein